MPMPHWVYGHGVQPGDWQAGELISLAEVRQVHTLAMTPVWDVAPHPKATPRERPGTFREHDVEPFPGGMQSPEWTEVPVLVRDWLGEAEALREAGEATITADLARLHARFEQVHPFLDGNGRAGRLILNLMLIRLGYPPAIIYKRDRDRYLAALRRADGGDTGPSGGGSGTGGAGQPLQIRRAGRRRPGEARAAAGAGNREAVR
jgi:cell filamentation protein, protein adenylyltransferase